MTTTAIFIGVIVAIILIYDLVIYLKKGDDWTISRVLLKLAKSWPIVPFLLGIVMGHIFWTNCGQ